MPDASDAMEMPTDTPYTSAGTPASPWAGLQKRVISALAMLTVVLFAELAGGLWFILLVALAAVQMTREWDALTEGQGNHWRAAGFVYVALPCAALIWLRQMQFLDMPEAGRVLVLYLFFVVWAADIGAYFTGRKLGGPKLAPAISPGKTWAGLFGGAAVAGAVGLVCASFTPYPISVPGCFFTGVLLAFVSQAGDLFESWLKRRAGVKDSGALIPGHGGLLDRIDGLIFAAPLFALMVALSGLEL